jgi:hypothetical protein
MRTRILFTLVAALHMGGCASSLKVYDAGHHRIEGMPVSLPVMMYVERVSTYQPVAGHEKESRYCTDDTVVTLELLPNDSVTYLAFDPATFGKGDFRLEFNDAGTLRVVSLTSEPRGPETLEAATRLASAVLPFVATAKVAPDTVTPSVTGVRSGQANKDEYCLRARTAVVRYSRSPIG